MAGDGAHEGGASSAARRLADLPHADFVRIMQHVVEYLDRANDEGLSLCARAFRDAIAGGATRAAFGKLPPRGPRGGSHGRSEAVRQAPELLAAMRRKLELDGHSNAEAARLLREFILKYWRSDLFEKCQRVGNYPDPDTPHYWAHDLILNGAVIHAGDLIGEERIARHLSQGRETPDCLSDSKTHSGG